MRACGGRVTLVGAGPGDPELLTLKAVRALQAADVILFDDLVSDEVLELARREARRMLVGKRGGRASCKQEDINAMMMSLAKAGKYVVRLKSGDPMIFGRGGEEITCLEKGGHFRRRRTWDYLRQRYGCSPRSVPDASRSCAGCPVRDRPFAVRAAAR